MSALAALLRERPEADRRPVPRGAQCGTWRTWDEAGRLVGTMEHGEQTLVP